MKKFLLFVVLVFPFATFAKTEVGELNRAQFRIDVPVNWNHGLVVYCHGYNPEPVKFDGSKPINPVLAVFLKAGYAVAQSGYSRGGWAVEQAMPETEALRRYFIEKYGSLKETYITGHSMGGFLTMALVEQHADQYDAGLPLCGPLTRATTLFENAFDVRVLFDYYFPGLLPSPVKVPADYKGSDERVKKILQSLNDKPEASARMRRLAGLRNNKDLADGIVFLTYVLKDLEERSGGNPFDNRDTIYTGTRDDSALNDGVKRYAADPGAIDYVKRFYTPTGQLARPMLAIHTSYDPVVSPSMPAAYALMTREQGKGELFVQQYVKEEGHCNITPAETEKGFAELRQWKESGKAPAAGWLH
jgi:pimeloyl-ACP methyl ester carboxylesterase